MPTPLMRPVTARRSGAPSAAMARAVGIVAALGLGLPLLFALWIASGAVRDWSFNQVTLYPARCRDAACRDWDALPRVRYAVDLRREEVVFWADPGWLGALGEGAVYRSSGCIVADRATWTCRSPAGENILAFQEGRPLRVDVFPVGARLVTPRAAGGMPYRFVARLQWYRAVLREWLLPRLS